MFSKKLLAIITMIFIASISTTAFAYTTPTSSITSLSVTCDPVTPSNNTCYNGSTFTINFTYSDNNNIAGWLVADGNQFNYKAIIRYGTLLANGDYADISAVAPVDSNVTHSSVCNLDGNGNDNNFSNARSCHIKVKPISSLGNGNYRFDVNIVQSTGTSFAAGTTNSDKNAKVSFTINNALATSQTVSLINMIPILLAGLAMVIGLVFVLNGATISGLISFIIGVIAIVVYAMLQTGMMSIFTG